MLIQDCSVKKCGLIFSRSGLIVVYRRENSYPSKTENVNLST